MPFRSSRAAIAWGPYYLENEDRKRWISVKANNTCCKKTRKLITAGAEIVASVAMMVLYKAATLPAQTRQEEVAKRGPQRSCPLTSNKRAMCFRNLMMAVSRKVVAKDASNKKQIVLIQAHLKAESEKFRKGDFSDPAKIHGEDMPGLAELKTGARKIDVRYTALPDGGADSIHNEGFEDGDGAPSMVFSTALRPRTSRYTSLRGIESEKGYSDLLFKDGRTERRNDGLRQRCRASRCWTPIFLTQVSVAGARGSRFRRFGVDCLTPRSISEFPYIFLFVATVEIGREKKSPRKFSHYCK